jgi:hypothetical protein
LIPVAAAQNNLMAERIRPIEQMLELNEGEPNSTEHLDSQVQKAQEQLVTLKRLPAKSVLDGLPAGIATSPALADVATLLTATRNELRISANGLPPVKVTIALPAAT